MNKGMLVVGIILLSLIALLMINVLTNYSQGQELDYYLVKETADAAMEDAIDLTYRRTCGLYRIDKEKFVESFVYRFANNVDNTRSYRIRFYDINEVPPKASIRVDSMTILSVKTNTGNNDSIDITTNYDVILETPNVTDLSTEQGLKVESLDECKSLLAQSS